MTISQCRAHGSQGMILWLKESFGHRSVRSSFQWPAALLILFCVLSLLLGSLYELDLSLLGQALLLLLVMIGNCVIVGLETKFRHREIHTKVAALVAEIRANLCKLQ